MIKQLFTSILVLCATLLYAQTVADFENFGLQSGKYLNNSGQGMKFESGNVILPNSYNPDWDAWTGWAISATTDTETAGFSNQYSAIPGKGYNNSRSYGVTYAYDGSTIRFNEKSTGGVVDGMFITNSTYAYLSMALGDAFAKRFGGETGDDPDYFLLTIKGYLDGEISDHSIEFYLADFRFQDNNQDYIVDTWEYIDLTPLGRVDSLFLSLSSSDVGQFGMNTPAYFCMDHMTTSDIIAEDQDQQPITLLEIFPNPVHDDLFLRLDNPTSLEVSVRDINGSIVARQVLRSGINNMDVSALPPGMYTATINEASNSSVLRFLKQ